MKIPSSREKLEKALERLEKAVEVKISSIEAENIKLRSEVIKLKSDLKKLNDDKINVLPPSINRDLNSQASLDKRIPSLSATPRPIKENYDKPISDVQISLSQLKKLVS